GGERDDSESVKGPSSFDKSLRRLEDQIAFGNSRPGKIKQQDQIKGHICRGKKTDGFLVPVFKNRKILLLEVTHNGPKLVAVNADVKTHEVCFNSQHLNIRGGLRCYQIAQNRRIK